MARTAPEAIAEVWMGVVTELYGGNRRAAGDLVRRLVGLKSCSRLPQSREDLIPTIIDSLNALPSPVMSALLKCDDKQLCHYLQVRWEQEHSIRLADRRAELLHLAELTPGQAAALAILRRAALLRDAGVAGTPETLATWARIEQAYGGTKDGEKASTPASRVVDKLRKHGFEILTDKEAVEAGLIEKASQWNCYHLREAKDDWRLAFDRRNRHRRNLLKQMKPGGDDTSSR